jgi:hypothetical protein
MQILQQGENEQSRRRVEHEVWLRFEKDLEKSSSWCTIGILELILFKHTNSIYSFFNSHRTVELHNRTFRGGWQPMMFGPLLVLLDSFRTTWGNSNNTIIFLSRSLFEWWISNGSFMPMTQRVWRVLTRRALRRFKPHKLRAIVLHVAHEGFVVFVPLCKSGGYVLCTSTPKGYARR